MNMKPSSEVETTKYSQEPGCKQTWPRAKSAAVVGGERTPFLVCFVCFVVTLLLMTLPLQAGPRDAQWKAVEAAIQKGLPKTAITNLESILQGALQDKAYAEAVKAIGQKIALEGNVQGNKPEEKITRLEAEIAKAPKEMVPLLDTLLADWYWQYFQQNRWRLDRKSTRLHSSH